MADYIPTTRAIDVLRRLNKAMCEPSSVRAFSLTGPYGAGKSSFALFLTALLGPAENATTISATRRLRSFAPDVREALGSAVQSFGCTDQGFIRAVGTAQREPVSSTVVRALTNGAECFWSGRVPRGLRAQLREAQSGQLSARDLSELVAEFANVAPVLMVIDEFGKNLEFFAQSPQDGDIFLLQQLAERVSGDAGAPVLFVTLQHVAFEEYAAAATTEQRREWSKVQGRFHDVSFLHDSQQTLRLIAQSVDRGAASERVRRDIRAWANAQFGTCAGLGLVPQLVGSADQIYDCYPLHPVTALAVSELCVRFGQHDRTLFSFLASDEPGSLSRFLLDQRAAPGALPALAIDAVWDHFLESAATSVRNSPDGHRWLEIDARVREVHGLGELELRCVKAVGLLNLLARGGALRASARLVAFGLDISDDRGHQRVAKVLDHLVSAGLLTYRQFADEFRIWEGTDFDIAGEVEASRSRLRREPVAALLQRVQPLRPVVASRHSQRVGMLRYFEVRFLAGDESGPLGAEPAADGLLGVVVGAQSPDISVANDRPVVLVNVAPSRPLAAAALESAAVIDVLERNEGLRGDWVARRELQERAGTAIHAVRAELDTTLRSVRSARLSGGGDLAVTGSFSRLVSDVCDRVYPSSPHVRNEVLGRRELSSQGAKARRELLSAMVSNASQARLGMDHFGPDRAMYEAVLAHTAMHHEAEGIWTFGPPRAKYNWGPSWTAAESLINERGQTGVGFGELYRLLGAPPFGVKEGPIPVLLTALLMARRDEIAVFQDGTYQAELTADVLERLVKTPERFSAKIIPVAGLRASVVEDLGVALGAVLPPPRRRNPTVIRVVAPLLSAVRGLPEYSRRTNELAPETIAVRDAIASARDPGQLLFVALPEACGIRPISPSARGDKATASMLADRVVAAVDELKGAYKRMLDEAARTLSEAFGLSSELPDLRSDLRARSRPFEDRLVDPGMRSFVLHVIDAQLDDEEWLEALLFTTSGLAPASWRDEDNGRFLIRIGQLAGAFRRLEALHYETVVAERAGFDARRVTVTAPTGHEVSSVFWVDHSVVEQVKAAAELALDRLEPVLGPRALPALLAVLAGKADGRGGEQDWLDSGITSPGGAPQPVTKESRRGR